MIFAKSAGNQRRTVHTSIEAHDCKAVRHFQGRGGIAQQPAAPFSRPVFPIYCQQQGRREILVCVGSACHFWISPTSMSAGKINSPTDKTYLMVKVAGGSSISFTLAVPSTNIRGNRPSRLKQRKETCHLLYIGFHRSTLGANYIRQKHR
jgi:hypothetical protein